MGVLAFVLIISLLTFVPANAQQTIVQGTSVEPPPLRWAMPPAQISTVGTADRRPQGEVQLAQALPLKTPSTAPTGATAKTQTIFSDDFAGAELSKLWEVVNPKPDNFIVENGKFLVVATSVGVLGNDKTQNMFRLNKPIPDSNWVSTVKFNVEFQTWKEIIEFGMFDDDSKNYLKARLYVNNDYRGAYLVLQVVKVSGGNTTEFHLEVTPPTKDLAKTVMQPISVRLTKEGHEYRAGVNFAGKLDEAGNLVWVDTGSVTSLRPPKTFMLNASQWGETSGESSFRINSVTIEAQAK